MYFLSVNKLNPTANPADIGRTMTAHVSWSKRLIGEGTLVQAGRWGDSGGMAIIRAADRAGAEAVQAQDPLVSSGLATYELARLYPDVEPE